MSRAKLPFSALFVAGILSCSLGLSACCLFREWAEEFARAMEGFIRGMQLFNSLGWSPWSPDGKTLLFAFTPLEETRCGVYRIDIDGTSLRRLTSGKDYSAAWSPDGTHIAYATFEKPPEEPPDQERADEPALRRQIWVMEADGSDGRQIAIAGPWLFPLTWTPDGAWLAVEVSEQDESWIDLIRPDGSERRRLGPGVLPVWSPDGTRLACLVSEEDETWIEVMDGNGSGRQRLTKGGLPSWSPDGTRLVFQDGEEDTLGIYVISLDSGERYRIATGMLPQWSPAGDRILFCSSEEDALFSEEDALFTISPEGTDERLLAAKAWLGRWSRDGS